MRRGTLCTLVVLAALAVGSTSSASAQTSTGGELGSDYVRATAADLGAGTFPGAGLPATAPSVDSPYTWTRADTGGRCVVFGGPVPPDVVDSVSPLPGIMLLPGSTLHVGALQGAPANAVRLDGTAALPPGAVLAGSFVIDTASPRDGSGDTFFVPRCAAPGDPVPPSLPDAATIWEQTPLPRGRIHASPPGTRDWPGIVNLESRFWGDPLPDVHATVSLDGYVVDVAARAVAYGWVLGDGRISVAENPPSPDAPLRTTFRRRGDATVRLYVTWAGLAHVTAPALGLDFGLEAIGTVTLPVSLTHHVAEIRALLRSRTARG